MEDVGQPGDDPAAAASSWYAQACCWTLARAHARSGDRIAIASYLGNGDVFDRALADYATAYADQNDNDYNELQKAVKSGMVTAVPAPTTGKKGRETPPNRRICNGQ